jgi:hypothetical protein
MSLRRLHAYEYLAVMKRDDICGSTDRKKIPVNLADPDVGYEQDVDLRRENDLPISRPHPSQCGFCECLARAQVQPCLPLAINHLNRWNHAADAGGRLRSLLPSCSARSSSFGYLIRVWSIFWIVNRKFSATVLISRNVRSHSSN